MRRNMLAASLLLSVGYSAGCASSTAKAHSTEPDAHPNLIFMEDKDLVPDEATAIKIASAVMEANLGADRFRYFQRIRGLKAWLDGDEWHVCHCKGIKHEWKGDVMIITRAVGLELSIARRTGEIRHVHPSHASQPRQSQDLP